MGKSATPPSQFQGSVTFFLYALVPELLIVIIPSICSFIYSSNIH